MRDIESAYRDAYLEEYEMCVRAGRTERAEEVAAILRDHYGTDVPAALDPPAPVAPEVPAPPAPAAKAARRAPARAKKPTE